MELPPGKQKPLSKDVTFLQTHKDFHMYGIRPDITASIPTLRYVLPDAEKDNRLFYEDLLRKAYVANLTLVPSGIQKPFFSTFVENTSDFNELSGGHKQDGDWQTGQANKHVLVVLTSQGMITNSRTLRNYDEQNLPTVLARIVTHEMNHVAVIQYCSPINVHAWLLESLVHFVTPLVPRKQTHHSRTPEAYALLSQLKHFPTNDWLKQTVIPSTQSPIIYYFTEHFSQWLTIQKAKESNSPIDPTTGKTKEQVQIMRDFLRLYKKEGSSQYAELFHNFFGMSYDGAFASFLQSLTGHVVEQNNLIQS